MAKFKKKVLYGDSITNYEISNAKITYLLDYKYGSQIKYVTITILSEIYLAMFCDDVINFGGVNSNQSR